MFRKFVVLSNASDQEKKTVPLFPSTRLGLAFIGFIGCIFVYALRINLSVALVCMVNHTALAPPVEQTESNISRSYSECDAVASNDQSVSLREGSLVWDRSVQGHILGAFFWGYLLTQVLGGWFAVRFGAKRVLAINVLASTILTLLTPVAANAHFGVLIALRALLGFAQGVTFPAFHTFWSHWAPPMERSTITAISNSGCQVGNVVGLPVAGLLCDYGFAGGWPSIFYVLGVATAIWLIIWIFFASDTPNANRRISDKERNFIVASLKNEISESDENKNVKTPWLEIFKSAPVWANIAAHFAGDWGAYTMLTCLPLFMKEVLRLDMTSLGFLASIPYIAYFICINIAGVGTDFVRSRGLLSTKNTRKIAETIALASQAIFLVAAGHCKCGQETIAIALLTLGLGFSGFQFAGHVVNYIDIAPTFSGVLLGIANTISCLGGILSPIIMGLMTPNKTRHEWLNMFWLTAGILLAGNLIYIIFADGQIQKWARVKNLKSQELEELNKKPEEEQIYKSPLI